MLAEQIDMRQINDFSDCRLTGSCVHCGGATETRDHMPSKVLLEKPYPENLPVVWACGGCNGSFSLDEDYLACLLACTLAGSTDPQRVERQGVRRILERSPALRERLELSRRVVGDDAIFQVEEARVRNLVLKLARGHANYELSEQHLKRPDFVGIAPLRTLTVEQRHSFEEPPAVNVWPEVGSRAMNRIAVGDCGWIDVQSGRYRYLAVAAGVVIIRMVLSEYLACEVIWQ